jgi:hypothetical protein
MVFAHSPAVGSSISVQVPPRSKPFTGAVAIRRVRADSLLRTGRKRFGSRRRRVIGTGRILQSGRAPGWPEGGPVVRTVSSFVSVEVSSSPAR